MTDFNYKKYSLENLENWMHDAMSAAEATPQEIYDVIKGVVEENYYTYKHQASQAYELLALLNGNGKGHIEAYDEYKGSTVSSVSNVMPPWGHSDMEALKYTDEELNAMCEKAASDEEKEKCREYNLREAEYYDKRAKPDTEHYKHSEHYYDYTRNDSKRQNPFNKVDKVKKWLLPIEPDPSGEYFVLFPDDLLEAAKLKEGDTIEWVDNNDGSYTLRKVTKPLEMDEC